MKGQIKAKALALGLILFSAATLGAQSWGDAGSTGYRQSINTSIEHPGRFAFDTSPNSSWQLIQGASSGWLENYWPNPTAVSGVELTASIPAGVQLAFSRLVGNQWVAIPGATVTGPIDGFKSLTFLDAETRTSSIHLTVSGAEASSASIGNLAWKLNSVPARLVKILPKSYTFNLTEYINIKADRMWDGLNDAVWFEPLYDVPSEVMNTTAGNKPTVIFPPYKGNPSQAGEIVWTLDGTYSIKTLKAKFSQGYRSIRFEFWNGASWTNGQTFGPGNTESGQGWQRIDLNATTTTDKLRITFPGGWERARFINEIEVWGEGNPQVSPRPLVLPAAVNDSLDIPIEDVYRGDLSLVVTRQGLRADPLNVEWNSVSYSATPTTWSLGNTVYRLRLSADDQRLGTQFLKVYQAGAVLSTTVAPFQEFGNMDLGWPFSDGLLSSTAAGANGEAPALTSREWTLGSTQLERLRVYSRSGETPVFKSGVAKNKNKTDWTSISWTSTGNGWWEASLYGREADVLSFASTTPMVLDEIQLSATTLDDSKTGLELWWPTKDSVVTSGPSDGNSVIGWLGNPAVSPLVAGKNPRQSNLVFWLPLSQIELAPGMSADVEATGKKDSATSKRKTKFHWAGGSGGTLDQGTQFIATLAPSFELSGTVADSRSRVFIDGLEIAKAGLTFRGSVALGGGFQPIIVQIWDKDKKKLLNCWRKEVWKPLALPILSADLPFGDIQTQNKTWTLSGHVGAGVGLSLTVDGASLPLVAGQYQKAVTLAEGQKSFLFTLSDNLGRAVNQTITLYTDSSPPSLSLSSPRDGDFIATLPLGVRASSPGETQLWWSLNSGDWELGSGSFSRDLWLADGTYHHDLRAQDSSGNLSNTVSATVVVDLTPPADFVVTTDHGTWSPNTTPVVSFATTDATSGMSHFELTVDNEAATTVTSPYQLPTLADGEHVIGVRAFDRAGNSRLSVVVIQVDKAAPLAFTPSLNISGWSNNNRPVVSFATTDAASGVDHFEASLDGSPWTTQSTGWQLPTLSDGLHSLLLRAVDRAGNIRDATPMSMQIDGTAPVAFVATSDSVGWSKSNRPLVSFETSDATSGIAGYQLRLDSGSWSTAESPYIMQELTDGNHRIEVKALDKAGNETHSTLDVQVDATAPGTPSLFAAVSSKTGILLQWERTATETEGPLVYSVERTPSLSSALTTSELSYFDTGLAGMTEYRYRVKATDRAGNESAPTEWLVVALGQADTIMDPAVGGVLLYKGVRLEVPAGALSSDARGLQITEIPVSQAFSAPVNPTLGPIYQIRTGREVNGEVVPVEHTDLAGEVTVSLTYNTSDLPSGFVEGDLRPFFYDSIWGRWVPIPGAVVNTNTHQVVFETNHFTDFSIQASKAVDLSPQQLRDVQFSPFGTNKTHSPVSISNEGGSVSTDFTEFVLPGKNGLDLVIKRVYDSGTAQADYGPQEGNSSDAAWSLGPGWRLNMPSMKYQGEGMWIKGLDGQMMNLGQARLVKESPSSDGKTKTMTLETHERQDLTALVRLNVSTQSVSVLFSTTTTTASGSVTVNLGTKTVVQTNHTFAGATLIHKDGRTVDFDASGRVARITDATGKNKILFDYSSGSPVITDTLGRIVTIESNGGRVRAITVAGGGEQYPKVEYSYTNGMLSSGRDVGGRVWSYGYTGVSLKSYVALDHSKSSGLPSYDGGFTPEAPKILTFQLLSSVSGPGIGRQTVGYQTPILEYNESQSQKYQTVLSHQVFRYRETKTYTEGPNGTSHTYYTDHYDTVYELVDHVATYVFLISQQRLLGQSVSVARDASPLRSTSYTFTLVEGTGRQFYTTSSTVNDGRIVAETQFAKTTKSRMRFSSSVQAIAGTTLSNSTIGFVAGSTEDVTYPTRTTTAPVGGSIVETVEQAWDTTAMRVVQEKRSRSATNYVQTNYVYDAWGNVKSQTQVSRVRDRETSLTVSSRYYGVAETDLVQGRADVPIVGEPALTRSIQGMLATRKTVSAGWVIGNTTPPPVSEDSFEAYTYSPLGQMLKAMKWNSDFGTWATSSFEYTTDHAQLAKVTGPTGQSTTYAYDYSLPSEYTIVTTQKDVSLGDSVADLSTTNRYRTLTGTLTSSVDAQGSITKKEYDYLDRVKRSEEPAVAAGVPVTQVTYDDVALTSKVINPLGAVMTYQFDALGRLTSVVKEQTVSGVPEKITTALEYDEFDQVTKVRGPVSDNAKEATAGRTLETLVTTFSYDNRGRVKSVLAPGETKPRESEYDDAANSVTSTGEEGQTSRQFLDWNGQVLENSALLLGVWLTQTNILDGAGRNLAQIDAKGQMTSSSYNSMGQIRLRNGVARSIDGNPVVPQSLASYNNDGSVATSTQQAKQGSTVQVLSQTQFVRNGLGMELERRTPVTVAGESKVLLVKTNYDKLGHPLAVQSGYEGEELRGTSQTFDSRGLTLTQTDGLGRVTSFEYDLAGNRTAVTDPRQGLHPGRFILTMTYDKLSRLIQARLPSYDASEISEIDFLYDGRGNLLQRTEPDGQQTNWDYNLRNLPLKQRVVAAGAVPLETSYRYDQSGRLVESKAPTGRIDYQEYDELDRVVRQGNDTVGWNSVVFDANGNPKKQIDGKGNTTETIYNEDNLPFKTTDAKGGVKSTAYDAWGRPATIKDEELNIRRYAYDELGRVLTEIAPWGATTTMTYDAWGHAVSSRDARGTETTRSYRADNRLQSEVSLNGSDSLVTTFVYDEGGDTVSVTHDGIETKYNFTNGSYRPDPFGLVRRKSEQVFGTTLAMGYGYDQRQRLSQVTTPDQAAVNYSYNSLGQLRTMDQWVAGELTYTAGTGQLQGYELSNGLKVAFGYDNQDRLSSLAYRAGQSLLKDYRLTYDKAGNITEKSENRYGYDELNRLVGANEKGWFQTSSEKLNASFGVVDRDYLGQSPVLVDLAKDSEISLDNASRSIGVDLKAVYGVNRIELVAREAGHRVRARDLRLYFKSAESEPYVLLPSANWDLQEKDDKTLLLTLPSMVQARWIKIATVWDDRDLNNKVVKGLETFTNLAGSLVKVWALSSSRSEGFEYDQAGNRIDRTFDGESTGRIEYYENADGRHLTWLAKNGEWYYQYDENGNLVTRARSATVNLKSRTFVLDSSMEYWTYLWDLKNRLKEVKKNGQRVALYAYDADNLRIASTKGSETTVYAYGRSGALTYQKNLKTGVARTYSYLGSTIVGWIDTASNGATTKYWATVDHLGSVTQVTDFTQKVVWASEYDPFGKTSGIEGQYDFDGSYAGHQVDRDTGLIYMWNRWQDPETGRFISEDPARAGSNWYNYANGNPLRWTDPTGLDAVDFYNNLAKTNGGSGTQQDYQDQMAIEHTGSSSSSSKSAGPTPPAPPRPLVPIPGLLDRVLVPESARFLTIDDGLKPKFDSQTPYLPVGETAFLDSQVGQYLKSYLLDQLTGATATSLSRYQSLSDLVDNKANTEAKLMLLGDLVSRAIDLADPVLSLIDQPKNSEHVADFRSTLPSAPRSPTDQSTNVSYGGGLSGADFKIAVPLPFDLPGAEPAEKWSSLTLREHVGFEIKWQLLRPTLRVTDLNLSLDFKVVY